MISAHQDQLIQQALRALAILAAALPDDSPQQDAVVEAVGQVAKAASLQRQAK